MPMKLRDVQQALNGVKTASKLRVLLEDGRLALEDLMPLMQALPARSQAVLNWRLGLADGKPLSLDAIGRKLGSIPDSKSVTGKRVRQLEIDALGKLRDPLLYPENEPPADWEPVVWRALCRIPTSGRRLVYNRLKSIKPPDGRVTPEAALDLAIHRRLPGVGTKIAAWLSEALLAEKAASANGTLTESKVK